VANRTHAELPTVTDNGDYAMDVSRPVELPSFRDVDFETLFETPEPRQTDPPTVVAWSGKWRDSMGAMWRESRTSSPSFVQ
jgi:hypothetical protein